MVNLRCFTWNTRRMLRICAACSVLTVVSIAGAGCGIGEASGGGEGGSLNIFAAASLTDAFEELGEAFREQNPEADVSFNFAGSSTLAVQIEQGAPADVFASADEEQMRNVLSEELVREPREFATNQLVVLVPENNPAGIESFEDLAQPDTRFVLAQEGVPVADYTDETLINADEEYGGGFREDVLENLVSREADVRAAANRVALGDADATFVYTSDLTPDIQEQVEEIAVPEEVNVIADYPISATESSENPELAESWVEFVISEEGQSVLEEWGFGPAEGQG